MVRRREEQYPTEYPRRGFILARERQYSNMHFHFVECPAPSRITDPNQLHPRKATNRPYGNYLHEILRDTRNTIVLFTIFVIKNYFNSMEKFRLNSIWQIESRVPI